MQRLVMRASHPRHPDSITTRPPDLYFGTAVSRYLSNGEHVDARTSRSLEEPAGYACGMARTVDHRGNNAVRAGCTRQGKTRQDRHIHPRKRQRQRQRQRQTQRGEQHENPALARRWCSCGRVQTFILETRSSTPSDGGHDRSHRVLGVAAEFAAGMSRYFERRCAVEPLQQFCMELMMDGGDT